MRGIILVLVVIIIIAVMCNPGEKTAAKPTPYDEFCDCKYDFGDQTLKLASPRWSEIDVLHKIIEGMNLPLSNYPFKLCQSKTKINGAAAFATQLNGYPYIIYDPEELPVGSHFTMFTIGHELGHLLLYHQAVITNDDVEKELEADFIGGVGMHILGIPLQEVLDIYSEDREANYPHSNGRDRRNAMKKGWLSREANTIGNNLIRTSGYGS